MMRTAMYVSETSRVYAPWRPRLRDIGVRSLAKSMASYRLQTTGAVEVESPPTSVSVVRLDPSPERYGRGLAKLQSLLEEKIEVKAIYTINYDNLIDWMYTLGKEPERDIELCVVKMFKGVSGVLSIYTDEYLEEKRFLLLLSNERYDDKLMDRLLDIEYDIRLQFRHQALSFVYLPKLYESVDEVVSPASKQIYSRSLDVIFANPSLASTS